mmetsp:Transcript_3710/g.10727  ORF Transcript_3710/g.10727 Transcript_3710/m.10727 type:complete len:230 (+) Transcript_3710:715-1404(+)
MWKLGNSCLGIVGSVPSASMQASLLAGSGLTSILGLRAMRQYYKVDPEKVYLSTMQQLNCHVGVLEAMGAPIAGADQRAYVVSGGDLYLKGLLPAVHPRSLHMVFLLRGADARGMVSVHAIKRKGKTEVRLLALDIPSKNGNNARIFLVGKPSQLSAGGLYDELFVPLKTVSSLTNVEEEKSIEGPFARDVLFQPSMSGRGGMYSWEHFTEQAQMLKRRVTSSLRFQRF